MTPNDYGKACGGTLRLGIAVALFLVVGAASTLVVAIGFVVWLARHIAWVN